MRARLYGFLGPIGVSVPVGGRRHAPRAPRPVLHPRVRTLTDAFVRWPWFAVVAWIDVLGAVALAVALPVTLLVTAPVALYLGVVMHRAARIRRGRR